MNFCGNVQIICIPRILQQNHAMRGIEYNKESKNFPHGMFHRLSGMLSFLFNSKDNSRNT